ncbi:MAG TPA: sodium:proton antiporter NhaD [Alphaproteobacteria bacterium]|nr:sodium:proton antiporter NhaD [Micavibrio sp.]HPQ51226.1 sodium:proton antiporter NhaD [Alphaproteobacteria bacterium]HRK98556.1 sodium:proton antiporter NhaD [Alphaproteobacteria bacterium]
MYINIFLMAVITLGQLFFPTLAHAETFEAVTAPFAPLISHPASYIAIFIFALSYVFVLIEEKTSFRKSKPVMIAAALIWALVSYAVHDVGMDTEDLHEAVSETIAEYGSLMLFLLVAMTYISALQERQVFDALRSRMVQSGWNYKKLFWATGIMAFVLSPLADNMTTALVMGAIVMALIKDDAKLVTIFMVNIVNSANAGGAFSPFGDITTLMVWQAGKVEFFDFLVLLGPSIVCFVIPATIMTFAIPSTIPERMVMNIPVKTGGKRIIALGLLTILCAITFEQILELPSFLGMMLGLGLLLSYGYFLQMRSIRREDGFDVFGLMDDTEWDTLLFFFGVIFCISGLGYLGYLEIVSNNLYGTLGINTSNILIGAISSLIDNIPLMFAVLSMNPEMSEFEWELLTLALGTGGSLLAIGSAAGVALMGTAKGQYTFMGHLKWFPVLLLGYAGGIATHYLLNG